MGFGGPEAGSGGAGSGVLGSHPPPCLSPTVQCLKILLSKTLGYGIVLGSVMGQRGALWGAMRRGGGQWGEGMGLWGAMGRGGGAMGPYGSRWGREWGYKGIYGAGSVEQGVYGVGSIGQGSMGRIYGAGIYGAGLCGAGHLWGRGSLGQDLWDGVLWGRSVGRGSMGQGLYGADLWGGVPLRSHTPSLPPPSPPVKLPQVLKIYGARSGAGLSVGAVGLELLALGGSVAYSVRHGFPFR